MQFPNDFINPANKGRQWCLDFVKAAWAEASGSASHTFYFNDRLAPKGASYRQIAEFMEARQPVDRYKPLLGVDEESRETWLNLDWRILPVVPKYVRICLGILDKQQYDIGFVPLDVLAKSEKDGHFARLKAKMAMREAAERLQSGLSREIGVEQRPGEPGDDEELAMMREYTYRHACSVEMEQDVATIFGFNKINEARKLARKDWLYYGVGGYRDFVDDGVLKIRKVRPQNLIVAPCLKQDFTDARYVGEVLDMTIAEFAQADPSATPEFCMEIANRHRGSLGNPNHCQNYDEALSFRIRVLDMEWQTVDDYVYDVTENGHGNRVVSRSRPKKGATQIRKRFKMFYRAKWVLETDHLFDYGRATDIKRPRNQLADVVSSYHLFAPDFSDGAIQSIGAQVVPVVNQIQLDWLNLQKFKSEARGFGIDIEMGALEDINYGKGGQKMAPHEVVDLFEKKFILLWRKTDRSGKDRNFRPISVTDGGGLKYAMECYQSIQMGIQLLKNIFGLNDFTDGSTPDPRSLAPTSGAAITATNNSLYGLINADATTLKSLAASVVIRLQDMEEMGQLERYRLALGDASVDFVANAPRLSHHDFAVEIREIATKEERAVFLQDLKALFGADMVTMEDVVLVQNTDNLKVAQILLAYRLRKRQEKKFEEDMMRQRQNAEVQAQAAMMAEEEKRKTLEVKNLGALAVANATGEWAYKVAEMNRGADITMKTVQAQEKIAAAQVAA